MADLSPLALRNTFGAHPTGIALIAAQVDRQTVGMLANSFTSVSLNPALVSLNFAHSSTTWPVLARAKRLGISLLAAGDREHAQLLQRPAAKRFEGIQMRKVGDGALVLPEAAATLIVDRYSEMEAGDHVVSLFQIVNHSRNEEAPPLVFHSGRMYDLAR
jgi:flavin reductase (DIM6/NTAB) family NADH-FMN oxidoreductase RutF